MTEDFADKQLVKERYELSRLLYELAGIDATALKIEKYLKETYTDWACSRGAGFFYIKNITIINFIRKIPKTLTIGNETVILQKRKGLQNEKNSYECFGDGITSGYFN